MQRNYYSSDSETDELDFEEEERLRKWDLIKHLNVDDYFSNKETKQLLIINWDDTFEKKLNNNIIDLFKYYKSNCEFHESNILSLADEVHSCDLINLIKYHTKKHYSLDIFEEEPDLAKPLYDSIKRKEEEERKKKELELQNKFNKSKQKFNWATKKYI